MNVPVAALVAALLLAACATGAGPTAVEADFGAFDRNGDGLVARAELDPGLVIHRDFHVYDSDDDGFLSPLEFSRFREAAGID